MARRWSDVSKSRQYRDIPFRLDLLKAWLTLRFNPSSECLVSQRGVKHNESRYLSPEEFMLPRFQGSAGSLAERLRTLLFEIMRSATKNIPQGETIGVLSSGGIDSTALMAILCKLGHRPEAFSIGFGTENDEIEAAGVAASFLGVPHHARVLDRILDSTREANRILDEPYRAACFYYDALRFVRDSGVKYVFDGLGVDEFFGGYDFRYRRVLDLMSTSSTRLGAYLQGAHPNDYVTPESNLFGDRLRHVSTDWDRLFPYFQNRLTLLDQIFLADYNAKCRQNFVPLAGFASSLGINILYPWLDDAFINFSLHIPTEWKYNPQSGETKILFRKAVQDLVPQSTMKKGKQGFGPTSSRVYEELKGLAEDAILDGYMVSNGHVNGDYYSKALDRKDPSWTDTNKLWDLYTLEVFLDELDARA